MKSAIRIMPLKPVSFAAGALRLAADAFRSKAVQISPPEFLFAIGRTNMAKDRVRIIQRALRENGISPGPIDGTYGHVTAAAVAAYQATKGLIVDGQVGVQTARRLKVDLAD